MVLKVVINLCMTEPEFLGKLFFPKKLGKGPKTGFSEFKEKFGH